MTTNEGVFGNLSTYRNICYQQFRTVLHSPTLHTGSTFWYINFQHSRMIIQEILAYYTIKCGLQIYGFHCRRNEIRFVIICLINNALIALQIRIFGIHMNSCNIFAMIYQRLLAGL